MIMKRFIYPAVLALALVPAGLFAQETVSISPFLVIEIAPCGQVTEASVSPGAQAKLQPDPLSQLSAVTT